MTFGDGCDQGPYQDIVVKAASVPADRYPMLRDDCELPAAAGWAESSGPVTGRRSDCLLIQHGFPPTVRFGVGMAGRTTD